MLAKDHPWAQAHLVRFFSRIGPESSGLTETVYGWGSNRVGWLGDGTDVQRASPTKVKKP